MNVARATNYSREIVKRYHHALGDIYKSNSGNFTIERIAQRMLAQATKKARNKCTHPDVAAEVALDTNWRPRLLPERTFLQHSGEANDWS